MEEKLRSLRHHHYMQDALYDTTQKSKVKAFQPGFRIFIGEVNARTREEFLLFRQLTYTCMDSDATCAPEALNFPTRPCPAGIMVSARFPTCWDGVNLDSPDHMTHMAYPESALRGRLWDTSKFNNKADWTEDGSQPFMSSFGEATGYANHADYMFGWKGDALKDILDTACVVNCAGAKAQSTSVMSQCKQKDVVGEDIDGWLTILPGGHEIQYSPKVVQLLTTRMSRMVALNQR
ncbi:hypothetical protein SCARD494_09921 [Seiridium cardinale]